MCLHIIYFNLLEYIKKFFSAHDVDRNTLYSEDVSPNHSIAYINSYEFILNTYFCILFF